jgi:AcrR family transcriptional regulator
MVPSKRARVPVTRAQAVLVAIELTDAGGLGSLTMRKLARALGVQAMSLYHHVKNKDDLLDGMVDFVFGEITLPADADCSTAMRQRAESARTVLSAHPWAIALIDGRPTPALSALKHYDTVVGCLRELGFSMAMAGHAMSLVDSYVRGFAMRESSRPTADEEFEFGLRLILHAIEAAHLKEAAS